MHSITLFNQFNSSLITHHSEQFQAALVTMLRWRCSDAVVGRHPHTIDLIHARLEQLGRA